MLGNPSKAQKDWHEWLRNCGCFICSDDAAIHHIKGSKMKLKGFIKPGEWYVLPLCYNHHQGDEGVHTNKRNFEKRHGTEKEMFERAVETYEIENRAYPMSEEDFNAIMERA